MRRRRRRDAMANIFFFPCTLKKLFNSRLRPFFKRKNL